MKTILILLVAVVVCAVANPAPQQKGQQEQVQYDPRQIQEYLQQIQQAQAQQQQVPQQPQQIYQQQPQRQQIQRLQPQYAQQQAQQPSLLGVAYSSAADVSKASFNGYGINYSF